MTADERAEAAERERDALRKALRPFADFASAWDKLRPGDPDDHELFTLQSGPKQWVHLMLSACRTARAAIAPRPPVKEE